MLIDTAGTPQDVRNGASDGSVINVGPPGIEVGADKVSSNDKDSALDDQDLRSFLLGTRNVDIFSDLIG